MYTCFANDAIKNPRMNVGTICVKYSVANTPNVASVPKTSSIINSISAIARNLHAARFFLLADAMKNCAAISPANIERIAAANCAIPYIQSYVLKMFSPLFLFQSALLIYKVFVGQAQ